MPAPGYYFTDGGTTPPGDIRGNPLDDQLRQRLIHSRLPVSATGKAPLAHNTTTSHQLATGNHELQGTAQLAGKEDTTTNLGWQKDAKSIDTLVGGISNEDLWMLIRRFNKAGRPFFKTSTSLIDASSKQTMSRRSHEHPPADLT